MAIAYSVEASDWSGGSWRGKEGDSTLLVTPSESTMSEKTESAASDCSVHSIIAALKSARQRALPSVANRINRGSEMEFRFCMGICSVKRADSRAKTLVAIQ